MLSVCLNRHFSLYTSDNTVKCSVYTHICNNLESNQEVDWHENWMFVWLCLVLSSWTCGKVKSQHTTCEEALWNSSYTHKVLMHIWRVLHRQLDHFCFPQLQITTTLDLSSFDHCDLNRINSTVKLTFPIVRERGYRQSFMVIARFISNQGNNWLFHHSISITLCSQILLSD